MKKYLIFILSAFLITSCTYRPNQDKLTNFKSKDKKVIKSFYKISSDTISFARLVTKGNDLFLSRGKIFYNQDYLTEQTLDKVVKETNNERTIDSLTNYFNKEKLLEISEREELVMFVQIIPDSAMTSLQYFRFTNLRHKIEGKIENELQSLGIGQWIAGDMGAGANMLFTTRNWELAFRTVQEILSKENLIDHVLITKRIITAEADWNYEIVYPVEYEGVFNSM
ncbi:hypothetical protein [Saccharicrinis aurantiacus]|uniref:hypothetical protein n=1 Tax=Saccharicrinis aurantiacus TaxID=1849719 RepID=UPI00094F927A|nr:hypothetical protein [Saccharicrinis aurantiacus]